MTSVAYVGQYFIERRFGRGFTRDQQRGSRLFVVPPWARQ